MEDTAAELVASPLNTAVGLALSTSQTGDSLLMMSWISGFGTMISSLGMGMLLFSLKEDEAFTCNLSKVATHPLKK